MTDKMNTLLGLSPRPSPPAPLPLRWERGAELPASKHKSDVGPWPNVRFVRLVDHTVLERASPAGERRRARARPTAYRSAISFLARDPEPPLPGSAHALPPGV